MPEVATSSKPPAKECVDSRPRASIIDVDGQALTRVGSPGDSPVFAISKAPQEPQSERWQ
ncbi:hypothetical protein PC119_g19071 [Phytophthora cactorum]|nr:hypothetical protein PC119_g19071 [Phytophthora cactorum]KAG3004471.1 hypothetical protein PC120_g18545 [Phytophthora cactorum]KAG3131023.1 hypothetical protein C6341_g23507 [Phytophthora cactorum]KAG3195727.1 hypothetical protein PC128_g8255 [Phytophthora cactorum]KAG4045520.1 hypothetical protein PC123_g19079 [Phytophthora cactorum]